MVLYDDFLNLLLKSHLLGFYIYQKKGKIVLANDRMAEIFGYSKKEDIIGKYLQEFLYQDKEQIEEIIKLRTEDDYEFEGYFSYLKDLILQEQKLNKFAYEKDNKFFIKEYFNYIFKGKDGALIYTDAIVNTVIYKGKKSGFALVIDKTKEYSYNKLYKALSYINKTIIEQIDIRKILKNTCDILVDIIGYSLASFGEIDEKSKTLTLTYGKSVEKEISEEIKHLKIDVNVKNDLKRNIITETYMSKKVNVHHNVKSNNQASLWNHLFEKYNIHSICAIPIMEDKNVKFILLIYDSFREAFKEDFFDLMTQIQRNLSFAMSKMEKTKRLNILNKAIERSHEWVLITNDKGEITFCNDAVEKISGFSKEDIIGKKPNIFKSGYLNDEFYNKLWNTIQRGEIFSDRFINMKKNGELFYLDKHIIPILDKGKIVNYVDLSSDVSEKIVQEKQIQFQLSVYNILFKIMNEYIVSTNFSEYIENLLNHFIENLKCNAALFMEIGTNNKIKSYKYKFSHTKQSENEKIEKIMESLGINIENVIKAFEYCSEDITNLLSMENKKFNVLFPIKLNDYSACFLLSFPVKLNNSDLELLKIIKKQLEIVIEQFDINRFMKMILTALDNGFDIVVITDSENNILYINDSALELLKYNKNELTHQNMNLIINQETSAIIENNKDISNKSYSGLIEYKTKSGNLIKCYTSIITFQDEDKTYFIYLGKKFSDEELLIKELEKLINYDPNTGIINSFAFKKKIESFIEHSNPDKNIFSIIIINPVNFAEINRGYSFEIGNKVLKAIAKRIKDILRGYDIVAKLESDRFGVLLKNLKNEDDAQKIANKISKVLSKPFEIQGNKIYLKFHFGVVLYPKDGENAEDLIHRAQIALLDAKMKKNGVVGFYSKTLELNSKKQLELKALLEEALKYKKEIKIYYQPYIDKNEKIVGAECLLRWFKDGELIPTGDFIEYLETMDLIVDIEFFVIHEALSTLKKLNEKIALSINLSKQTLLHSDFEEFLIQKIEEHKIKSDNFILEIVERAYIDDFEKVNKILTDLKKYNIKFALDDFGTGYSSLSHISALPVQYLKIDLTFISKILTDTKVKNVVHSMIFLAKKLGIKTIAEGIERQEQFELLKEMGCDYFQGFLFYKPLPFDKFITLIE